MSKSKDKITYKKFRDPIYGYIEVDEEICRDIIDTDVFQRLRHIGQVSYAALYPSASHNRFVHSLGVYHLGRLAFDTIVEHNKNLEVYRKVFELACLLHDIGHAPFSHTGEGYFFGGLEKDDYGELEPKLKELVENNKKKKHQPNKHEIMSCEIALNRFGQIIGDEEKSEFFCRCIMGIRYENASGIDKKKNALISLLNSNTIDVDKIDYLMRDTRVMGFDGVAIDYVRLLCGVRICGEEIAFDKSALSVIENVVYSRDQHKKWIQSHPIIAYETYLIKQSVSRLSEVYPKNSVVKLFSKRAISKDGIALSTQNININIRLVSDIDILFLMKQNINDRIIGQYFDRNSRYTPLWKTESEFMSLFGEDGITLGKVLTIGGLADNNGGNHVGVDSISSDQTTGITRPLIEALGRAAQSVELTFDFYILKADQYESGFSKADLGEIIIKFSKETKKKLKEVGNLPKAESKEKGASFFYLFYKKTLDKNGKIKKISKKKFADTLKKELNKAPA